MLVEFDMRRQNDPVETKRRILAAASKLFIERGYGAASMGDVADEAGVPKSLIQYHFETKEGLWSATCEDLASPLLLMIGEMLEGSQQVEIVDLLERRFRLFQEKPEMAKLIAMIGMGQAPLPEVMARAIPKVLGFYSKLLSTQPDRIRQLFMLVVSAQDGWFLHRNVLPGVLNPGVSAEKLDEDFLNYLLQIIKDEVTILREA